MIFRLKLNTEPITLEIRDLCYQVGHETRQTILEDIRFSAHSGELIGIVGPNGAGKSTLLRQIGGLLRPTSGEASLNGRPTSRIHPGEMARICTFMHQDTTMPFAFPVRDVAMMGRHPYSSGMTAYSAADEAYVEACLTAASCQDIAEKMITELSAGERQRVMFARALAQDTPLLLLDEPTASLDIRYANEVYLLARHLAEAGKLVLVVMHDLRAAAKYCSRLCLLHQGKMVADGDPEVVLHEGHITYAYDIRATTFQNPVGQWDFYVDDL
jgi:iron complex transport system ATP-binding protein